MNNALNTNNNSSPSVNKKLTKGVLILIIITSIIAVIITGTYAWFTWSSTNNPNITLNIGKLADVIFDSGPNININDLSPVYNYIDGESTTFSITNKNTTGTNINYSVILDIQSIAPELVSNQLKYVLLKDNNIVKEGNFRTASTGGFINLYNGTLQNNTNTPVTSNYTFYIYIDGNEENNPNMMNKSLVGEIRVSDTNVLKQASDGEETSPFLGTTLIKNTIESIEFTNTNVVPASAIGSFDVSANNDESVKLWYTDIDNNNLFEAYIGSINGIVTANTNSSYLFSYLTQLKEIDFKYFDTSKVTNMERMFKNIKSLSLDLSNFDTSKVTNMYEMFYYSNNLTSLDLSNFDTSNVTNMSRMFSEASSLTNLDLSSFDTSKVTNMYEMFYSCGSLISLNLSNFNTSKVTNMYGMFRNCTRLNSLDLSSFDTSSVEDISYIFFNCRSLTSLDVSSFNTSNITNMYFMFYNASSLINLNLSNFDTSNVLYMGSMFSGCNSLASLDFSRANFTNVTNYDDMFHAVPNNATIYVKDTTERNWITSRFNTLTGITIAS